MRFDPFWEYGYKAIWHNYKEFEDRPALSEMPRKIIGGMDFTNAPWQHLDMIVRYVILYCTKHGNPLSRERDFEYKRKEIFKLLQLKPLDVSRKLIEAWDPWVGQIMAVYMRLINERQYAAWWALKTSYEQDLHYLALPLHTAEDPEKMLLAKQRIRNNMDATEKKLNEMESSLFPDDHMLKVISEYEGGVFDGVGSYADYQVPEDWPR